MKKLRSTGLILSTLVALIITLSACSSDEATDTNTQNAVQADVITLSPRLTGSVSTFGGEIRSTSSVNIATKIMGEVQEVPYQIGESFSKGDIILKIKQDQLLAREAQAKAALNEATVAFEQAQKDLQRFKELYEQNSASQKELESAQNHLDASRSRVAMARAGISEVEDLMSYTAVKAPFNGVVSGKFMEAGDLASPGMPVLSIEKAGSYKFTFTVPESRINEINTGDSLIVSIPALSGKYLSSRISRVNRSGENLSRQFRVEAILEGSVPGIRSGMYAEAALSGRETQQIVIPASSLLSRGQLKGVYVVNEGGYALLKWINTGKQTEGGFVVLSGLSAGEKIIREINGSIYDGALIANN